MTDAPQLREDQIAGVVVEFVRDLTRDHTVAAVLNHLGDRCRDLLSVAGVGVLLLEDGRLSVATCNSEIGDRVETLEVELEEGPCAECVRVGHNVYAPDLAAVTDRYPHFAPRALEAGAGSIHAVPMTGHGELVGSLNIIDSAPRELTGAELSAARMLSDVAVSYIFAVRLHEETSKLAGQLQNALDSRVIIEQAKGMLAQRHGEPLADAFERLRRYARSRSTPVREIARQIVEDGLHP